MTGNGPQTGRIPGTSRSPRRPNGVEPLQCARVFGPRPQSWGNGSARACCLLPNGHQDEARRGRTGFGAGPARPGLVPSRDRRWTKTPLGGMRIRERPSAAASPPTKEGSVVCADAPDFPERLKWLYRGKERRQRGRCAVSGPGRQGRPHTPEIRYSMPSTTVSATQRPRRVRRTECPSSASRPSATYFWTASPARASSSKAVLSRKAERMTPSTRRS